MANTYKDKGLTGKSGRKMENVAAQALVAPVVEKHEAVIREDKINDATKSGKQKGAMIILHDGGKFGIAVAAGGSEQDVWNTVAFATKVTHVTPSN